MQILLQDIIDAIESSHFDTEYYLDTETGDFEMVVDGELLGNPDIDLMDDRYIKLPDRYEINEYRMLKEFASAADDPEIRQALLESIDKKSAFVSFKDKVRELGVEQHWYHFRDECYRQIAIEWCSECGIDYIEKLESARIVIGGEYEHFKGNRYQVLEIATHSETLEELVIYREVSGENRIWARPLPMFCDKVQVDGELVDRFRLVGRKAGQ